MITLYTPATGFPDLEAKIAYGLARVGIEAGAKISIIPFEGFYKVSLKTQNKSLINSTFYLLLERLLSSQRFYDLGVKPKYRTKYPVSESVRKRLSKIDLFQLYQSDIKSDFDFTKHRQCGHKGAVFGATQENEKRLGGLILLTSVHAGKPQYRDNRGRDLNLGLCEICGYLSVLGKESFGFTIQLGKGKNRKYVSVTPMAIKELETPQLNYLLSTQKTLHDFWLSDLIPLNGFTLGLLAKVPSLSDIVSDLQLNFHLALLSKDNKGDTVVEQTAMVNTLPFAKFISYSPYNSATVEKILAGKPKISTLIELTSIVERGNLSNLSRLSRLYVQETLTDSYVYLLYPETARYLLEEVAMIKPEIIKNEAISSVASTLRYFIRDKKYHYADDIRNARKDSKDFEGTIVKMLREAELRRVQEEEKKKAGKEHKFINIPDEKEIKELFQLANEDFDAVKTTLVILAFSFPMKREKIEEGGVECLNM